MKIIIQTSFLIFIIVNIIVNISASSIRREIQDITTEIISGQTFKVQYSLVDGLEGSCWSIDGQEVTQQEYDTMIITAKTRELQDDQVRSYALKQERIAFEARAQRALIKKLLLRNYEIMQDQIKQIRALDLDCYLVFNEARTLTEDQYQTLVTMILPQVEQLLADEQASMITMEKFCEQLEAQAPRLILLVQDSIEQAIAQCNDTQLLKKLLTVVI